MNEKDPLSGPPLEDSFIEKLRPLLQVMAKYHRYEAHGLEHIPSTGPALLVVNHSFATYDGFLLGGAILVQVRRKPWGLADSNFWKIETVGKLAARLGLVEASHDNAEDILARGKLLSVAPGGMREALRPIEQRHHVLWKKRKGFIRLAIKTGAQVILAACPQADDLYDVYPTWLTKWAYKNLKIPLVFLQGWGPTMIPKPVKLVHHIARPMQPPKVSPDDPEFEQQVELFHHRVVERMEQLMQNT